MRRRRRSDGRMRAAVLVALLAACSSAPAPDESSAPARVVVLGVDGLDFRMLESLVGRGELPSFARLYREGASGRVSTAPAGIPPQSPRIWTSFATGVLPEQHGIEKFVFSDAAGTKRMYSSAQRRAPAAWEIAAQGGKSAGVVNWWFTYPAEAVRGFVISDRYFEEAFEREAGFHGAESRTDREGVVYPAELGRMLPRLRLARGISPQIAEVNDRRVVELAVQAASKYPVDLLMIYTRALDELSHLAWGTHERLPGEPPAEKDLIVDYLQRYDRLLETLLGRLTAADHLVVISDHGFERAKRNGPAGLTGEHESAETAWGVLLLAGPRVAPGARVPGDASLLDVLPTVLELLGVPPSQDLPGRVLAEVFRPGQRRLLARAPAYERALPPPAAADGVAADPATVERLRQLGYDVDGR